MITKEFSHDFVTRWIEAWNSHQIDDIMVSYADDIALISPVAFKLRGHAEVSGFGAVRDYFSTGLTCYPDLQFTLIDIIYGIESIVLIYSNQNGTTAAEYMQFNQQGKICRMSAHYAY